MIRALLMIQFPPMSPRKPSQPAHEFAWLHFAKSGEAVGSPGGILHRLPWL